MEKPMTKANDGFGGGTCSLCGAPGADCEEWFPDDDELVPVHSKCFALLAMGIEMVAEKRGEKLLMIDVDKAIQKVTANIQTEGPSPRD